MTSPHKVDSHNRHKEKPITVIAILISAPVAALGYWSLRTQWAWIVESRRRA